MNTSGLLKVLWASLTLQEARSIHDSMNIPKVEFISEIGSMEKNEPFCRLETTKGYKTQMKSIPSAYADTEG